MNKIRLAMGLIGLMGLMAGAQTNVTTLATPAPATPGAGLAGVTAATAQNLGTVTVRTPGGQAQELRGLVPGVYSVLAYQKRNGSNLVLMDTNFTVNVPYVIEFTNVPAGVTWCYYWTNAPFFTNTGTVLYFTNWTVTNVTLTNFAPAFYTVPVPLTSYVIRWSNASAPFALQIYVSNAFTVMTVTDLGSVGAGAIRIHTNAVFPALCPGNGVLWGVWGGVTDYRPECGLWDCVPNWNCLSFTNPTGPLWVQYVPQAALSAAGNGP